MEKKQFSETLKKVLTNNGFSMVNKTFYYETEEVIIVIATQKSNFENSYYINYGFKLKDKTLIGSLPKDNECDTFGRFIIKNTNSVNYELLSESEFEDELMIFVSKNIKPVISDGLAKYYEINPKAIFAAAPKVKKYLNL